MKGIYTGLISAAIALFFGALSGASTAETIILYFVVLLNARLVLND